MSPTYGTAVQRGIEGVSVSASSLKVAGFADFHSSFFNEFPAISL